VTGGWHSRIVALPVPGFWGGPTKPKTPQSCLGVESTRQVKLVALEVKVKLGILTEENSNYPEQASKYDTVLGPNHTFDFMCREHLWATASCTRSGTRRRVCSVGSACE
jgi:hypothetical protein